MDLITLFFIFGAISLLLIIIQFIRIVKKGVKRKQNIVQNEGTLPMISISTIQSEMNNELQPRHTILNMENEEQQEDIWLFTVTSNLLDKISIVEERQVHFNEKCAIQSIYPFPKNKQNCYFEIKVVNLPETTNLYIGVAPKDETNLKLPGKSKDSISYDVNSGKLNLNDFTHEYGNRIFPGDVIGCGYRPNNARVFYTRNGRRYPRVVFESHDIEMYPTIYADGICTLEYNFGQSGFVLLSANSRNYGLTEPDHLIVPPPSYLHYSSDLSIKSPRDNLSFFSDDTISTVTSPTHPPPPPPYLNNQLETN